VKRVAVFAATRADLFPLKPVLSALARSELHVTLVVTASVPSEQLGPHDVADGVEVHSLPVALETTNSHTLARSGSVLAWLVTDWLQVARPDVWVVLGDRWELMYAVPPAVLGGVPVVHLHGGEVTEGAVDDRVRHAVTKLADRHCVSTDRAAARVRQMGEPSDRVHVTGAPSLDRARSVRPAAEPTLERLVGGVVARPLALVTYHPVTIGGPAPADGARVVLEAVADTCPTALVTHPGADPGREEVLRAIAEVTAERPSLRVVPSLGGDYLAVLAASDVVVGNSSSGIIEAATLGVPVVDVGDRQRGRERSANVLHVTDDREEVARAVRECLTEHFRARARSALNVYGDGHSAHRVTEVVLRAACEGQARKPFVECGPDPAAAR
jgi:UDP-N-acetylglucosamine 2-epimerase (non-hydrolysing)